MKKTVSTLAFAAALALGVPVLAYAEEPADTAENASAEAPSSIIDEIEGKVSLAPYQVYGESDASETEDSSMTGSGGDQAESPCTDFEYPDVVIEGPASKPRSDDTPHFSELDDYAGNSDADVSLPKREGGIVQPDDDIVLYGPKIDVDAPDVDVNLPKGDVDIFGPKADIDVPDVDIPSQDDTPAVPEGSESDAPEEPGQDQPETPASPSAEESDQPIESSAEKPVVDVMQEKTGMERPAKDQEAAAETAVQVAGGNPESQQSPAAVATSPKTSDSFIANIVASIFVFAACLLVGIAGVAGFSIRRRG